MTVRARYLARTSALLCERTALLGDGPRSSAEPVRIFPAPAFFASMHARGLVQREVTRRPAVCRRGAA
jgi:hypothetical protein